MSLDQLGPDMIDKLQVNPFIDGPTEALVKTVAKLFRSVPEFKYIFGDSIDGYERSDYGVSQLPALRIYNFTYRKEQESHYIGGELIVDVVYPASLRRDELQLFQDVMSAAILQQFRRPNYFAQARELVPGLNELGKTFDVDKTLGMRWQDGYVPITEMKANFRIDLKIWDSYLESTGRTKDEPFQITLKNLRTIAGRILPYLDNETPEPGLEVDLTVQTGGS